MEIKFDLKKMEQNPSKESRFEWNNGRPYTIPLYFSCTQNVPCATTPYPILSIMRRETLSDEVVVSIRESLEDIKHGHTRSLEEISREMGI